MRRSVFAALVVGALAGLGVQLALAQPINSTGDKFRNLTATGTVKAAVVDAGVLYVVGAAQLGSGLVKVGATVDVSTDFTVSGNNDTVLNRQLRVNGDMQGSSGAKRITNTAPTVVACSGTAASVTWSNDSAVFVFDVGTSCAGESTAVVTFEASSNGYVCSCSSTTADRIIQQKVMPASTTQVTLQNIVISTGANGDFTDGADVACQCTGG